MKYTEKYMNHKRKEVMQMNKPKIRKGTIRRLLGYIKKNYMKQFIAVFICIVLSSIATVAGSLFLQKLIDDYITPLLGDTSAGFGPLLGAIGIMVIIYVVGITTSYLYIKPSGEFFQLVSPICSLEASALLYISSAAVCPEIA